MLDSDEYVKRGSADDHFPTGEAEIVYCLVCGVPLLVKPGEKPDCGTHNS